MNPLPYIFQNLHLHLRIVSPEDTPPYCKTSSPSRIFLSLFRISGSRGQRVAIHHALLGFQHAVRPFSENTTGRGELPVCETSMGSYA